MLYFVHLIIRELEENQIKLIRCYLFIYLFRYLKKKTSIQLGAISFRFSQHLQSATGHFRFLIIHELTLPFSYESL